MLWQIPVFLRVVVAHAIYPFLQKKIVSTPAKTTRLALQFFCCAILATIIGWFRGELTLGRSGLVIAGLGFFNGLAAYCSWRAVDISLTKNSLFTFWDDIIGMTLSYIVLKEGKFLNPWISAGIVMSVLAACLFAIHSYRQKKVAGVAHTPAKFFFFVGAYSVVWGVATFLMRYWSLKDVSVGQFLFHWYSGAFVAAVILLYGYRETGGTRPAFSEISWRDRLLILTSAVCIFVALGLAYLSYTYAPQVVVQPIFLVSEMILPALIGLFGFAERKQFDSAEWCFLGLGSLGGLIIVLNF